MRRMTAQRNAWIIGGLGVLGSIAAWLIAPSVFPHAWLAAVSCFLAWPLGSLALVLIHALTGGRWGLEIRPQLAAAISTLPLLLPAVIPLLFVTHDLYPWMHAEARTLPNRFYLNPPFFYARWALYLAIWQGLSFKVLRALRADSPDPDLYRLAPPALILLALTVTFAAIDSILSMEPQFKSSIFGMLVFAEAILFALSGALLLQPRAPRPEAIRDLARLLLALVVLWAYLDFMQLLIIWNSDLPDEAGWYLHRLRGFWGIVAAAVAGLHFALPFFALLSSRVQRSPSAVRAVAAMLVVTGIVRAWWLVVPASGRLLGWPDVAAMAAVLGLAAGLTLHRLYPRQGSAGVPAYG